MLIVVVSLVNALILSLFIVLRYRASSSFLEPGIIFAGNLLLLYPIRAIVLFAFGDQALPDYPGADEIQNLEMTTFLSFFGCVGYVIGYLLVMGRRKLSILDSSTKMEHLNACVRIVSIMWLLSLVGAGYKIATGDYMSYLIGEERTTGLTHLSHLLVMFQWPAFLGALILWFGGCRDKMFLLLFAGVMITVIPYQFFQGSKTFLSLLIVEAIVAYYWVRKKLPGAAVLIGVTLIIGYVFPFVSGFREYVNTEFGRIPSITEIQFSKVSEYSEPDPRRRQDKDQSPIFKFSARYGGADHLYGISETVPRLIDYEYGFAYSAIIVNLIPRAVWPDKPIYSRGASYGSSLGTTTSVTPFPFGEAYWDFGELGLPLMMIVWGGALALLTRLYEHYFDRWKSFLILTYFLSQIYWISGGETSMPMVFAGIPQQVVMLALVYFLAHAVTARQRSGLSTLD